MIAERIAKASAIVGGRLKADSRNKEQGYDYISADKILAECGQALAEVGVMVAPQIDAVNITQVDRGNGKVRYDVMVNLTMTITDGESAQVCQWVGMGTDYIVPDKAMYKAVTSGHKYFLSKLLNVGEGNEDGEHEPELPAPQPTYQAPRVTTSAQRPHPPAQFRRQQAPGVTELLKDIDSVEYKHHGNEYGDEMEEEGPVDNPFTDGNNAGLQPAADNLITDKQLKMLHALGIQVYGADGWKEKRPKLVEAVTKGARRSASDLLKSEAKVLIDGLVKKAAMQEAPPPTAELVNVEPLAF